MVLVWNPAVHHIVKLLNQYSVHDILQIVFCLLNSCETIFKFFPLIPYISIFFKSILWSTVSNALLKSMKIPSVYLLSLKASNI